MKKITFILAFILIGLSGYAQQKLAYPLNGQTYIEEHNGYFKLVSSDYDTFAVLRDGFRNRWYAHAIVTIRDPYVAPTHYRDRKTTYILYFKSKHKYQVESFVKQM